MERDLWNAPDDRKIIQNILATPIPAASLNSSGAFSGTMETKANKRAVSQCVSNGLAGYLLSKQLTITVKSLSVWRLSSIPQHKMSCIQQLRPCLCTFYGLCWNIDLSKHQLKREPAGTGGSAMLPYSYRAWNTKHQIILRQTTGPKIDCKLSKHWWKEDLTRKHVLPQVDCS